MKTIKENEQLHISSGVYEDNTTLREYDFVVVNDREDSPIGAVWLGIFRDENNPKEKWQLESHVFLRENCKAEELFENIRILAMFLITWM
jgi:hypothetical protein